jgi:UDP-GlcNAc3NAcA epimerase
LSLKIVTIVGARPQFIKASTVSKVVRGYPGIRQVLVHTGQHFDPEMSEVFFSELDLPQPDYHLGINGVSHGAMTGRMLEAIEGVLVKETPDWLLVYGDTNSTLAGALAGVKLNIRCAHVEAGLRSFNRRMPEEINRILTDHASDLMFAPTESASGNLAKEGIPTERVRCVGDVMYDAALNCSTKADETSDILERHSLTPREYVLATVHRAENTDNPARLRAIVRGLGKVSREVRVILPLHPRTRLALKRDHLIEEVTSSMRVIDPLGYLDMIMLEKNAGLIATDSGGVQKEAYFYRVPCVTLRSETEWTELVETGWNSLADPADEDTMAKTVLSRLNTLGAERDLYGNGLASQRIVEELLALS